MKARLKQYPYQPFTYHPGRGASPLRNPPNFGRDTPFRFCHIFKSLR